MRPARTNPPSAPCRPGRERSSFAPSLGISVLLHAGLAALVLAMPGASRAPPGRVWIELRPPPPPPPAPREPPRAEPAPAPSREPRFASGSSRGRPVRGKEAASARPVPALAGASPLSGLDASGPGLPFDLPTEGPRGMPLAPPGAERGASSAGPARRPPIRLDDGTHTHEEVLRIAREVKEGLEAQPHSFVVQKFGGPVARQSTFFPGYGEVPSDRVCHTRDGKALRTTIPAFDLTVCDRYQVDLSRIDDHTDAPPVVCVESHVEHIEEKTLEAPRSYLSHECMERDRDLRDVDWEKRTIQNRCIRWIDVERENPLVYRAKRFTDSFDEDRGISMKLELPPCDEPAEEGAARAQPSEDGSVDPAGG